MSRNQRARLALCLFARAVAGTETETPTPFPTYMPTPSPTNSFPPTPFPSVAPTLTPTASPSLLPAPMPTAMPTIMPTPAPSGLPTISQMPTISFMPTPAPSIDPTPVPTTSPGPTPAPSDTPIPAPTSKPSEPLAVGSPTSMPTAKVIAELTSAIVMSGMTAADFTETQKTTFKTALVSSISYIDSTDDVTRCEATDVEVRRLRRLLSGSVQIDFTVNINLIEGGLSTTDADAVASSVSDDLTAAVTSGNFSSAIADAAAASGDTTFAAASVNVDASTKAIRATTSASIPSASSPDSDDDDGGLSPFAWIAIWAACSLVGLVIVIFGGYQVYVKFIEGGDRKEDGDFIRKETTHDLREDEVTTPVNPGDVELRASGGPMRGEGGSGGEEDRIV